jgi:hypothetical protein
LGAEEAIVVTKDEEVALLGILESQLGATQTAMHGLHLGEDETRQVHVGLLRLQQQIRDQSPAAPRFDPSAQHHRRPIGWVVTAGVFVSCLCAVALIVLLLG